MTTDTDTMTERPELGPALSAYRLYATVLHPGDSPFLELDCPEHHQDGRDTDACSTNLLTAEQRGWVELSDLVRLAVMHDDLEPSIERTSRISDLQKQMGQLGCYPLAADDDGHPFLIMSCPYEGGRCPGSEGGECVVNLIPEVQGSVDLGTLLLLAAAHEDARFGVPVERLIELRQRWITRQRAEVIIRETADGPSAGLASSRADLYGRLIAELDRAMAHG
jgi:hypothetical protein